MAAPVDDVDAALAVCRSAAETKEEDGDAVVAALLTLEKGMRALAKESPEVSAKTLEQLDGCWRLVFTTGTISRQKRTGARVNYFPVKAVQTFDLPASKITNGIFFGDWAAVRFFGIFWADIGIW